MGTGARFADGAFTLYGAAFQRPRLAPPLPCPGPATPAGRPAGLGSVRFRSPLLTESLLLSLPPATEMFHFAGFAPGGPWIRPPAPSEDGGLPHSETPGSKTACVSPGLFAACRVLRRLPPPRHPPCARTSWTPGNRFPGRRGRAGRSRSRGGFRSLAVAPLAGRISQTFLYTTASLPPARLAADRRGFQQETPGAGPRRRGAEALPRPVHPVVKDRRGVLQPLGKSKEAGGGGGRTWTRTMDLVLIRDAL